MAPYAGQQAQSQSAAPQQGPPHRSEAQPFGELPSVLPDVPVCAVFLFLFLTVSVGHAIVFRRNWTQGKKFQLSVLIAVFCFIRAVSTSLRIAWACEPTNTAIGIAAMVFVYAGIPILFIINLLFTQRIVRAQHPTFGWSKPATIAFPVSFITTGGTVVCLIVASVVGVELHDNYSKHAARKIQEYGSTMLAIIAVLPFIVVSISSLARQLPRIRMTKTTDKFGQGSMRVKVVIVLISSALLSLGAWFRDGTALHKPTPVVLSTSPLRYAPEPWYLSKTCFYVFNFTIEIMVCIFWLVIRVDRRFYIPDRARGPFSYAGGFVFAGEAGNQKNRVSNMHASESQQNINRRTSMQSTGASSRSVRSSRIGERISWAAMSQEARIDMLDKRVSWGGISMENIRPDLAEDGVGVIPYPEGDTAADSGIEGGSKQMGWDAKTGKWALRPVSGISSGTHSPVSPTSESS